MHTETHRLVSDDGIEICLHERSVPDPDEIVVFVHGATYAGRAVFDPHGAPDRSWLRWAASDGAATFAVDIRGYGDSERPPEMVSPETAMEPPVRAVVAATDVETAIEFLEERYSRPVHLVGTSWGTMIVGTVLARRDCPDVASATLYAPVFEPDRSIVDGLKPRDLSVSRTVTRSEALSRWNDQIPFDPPAELRGGSADRDPVFEAFWATLTATRQGEDGDAIIAPNGTLVDLLEASTGAHVYDPSEIQTPTLVIRGSLDPTSTRTDAMLLYDALDVSGDRSMYVELAGGTHFFHLEQRRTALYEAVAAFQNRHHTSPPDQVS